MNIRIYTIHEIDEQVTSLVRVLRIAAKGTDSRTRATERCLKLSSTGPRRFASLGFVFTVATATIFQSIQTYENSRAARRPRGVRELFQCATGHCYCLRASKPVTERSQRAAPEADAQQLVAHTLHAIRVRFAHEQSSTCHLCTRTAHFALRVRVVCSARRALTVHSSSAVPVPSRDNALPTSTSIRGCVPPLRLNQNQFVERSYSRVSFSCFAYSFCNGTLTLVRQVCSFATCYSSSTYGILFSVKFFFKGNSIE